MAFIQIDKLLETVVREKASDLHITTGQPPVVRAGGQGRQQYRYQKFNFHPNP